MTVVPLAAADGVGTKLVALPAGHLGFEADGDRGRPGGLHSLMRHACG